MSVSRPAKKRALMPLAEGALTTGSSASRPWTAVELETAKWKTLLERERSQRSQEQQEHQRAKDRLQQMILLIQKDAEYYQDKFQEMTETVEQELDDMTLQRDHALETVRQLEEALESLESEQLESTTSATSTAMWRRKCVLYEEQLQGKNEELDSLQNQVQLLRTQLHETLEQPTNRPTTPPPPPAEVSQGASSPAPAALLHELQRLRIQLAETERSERQWRRIAEEGQKQTTQLVEQEETSRQLQRRTLLLEKQLVTQQREYAVESAEHQEWVALGQTLQETLWSGSDQDHATPAAVRRKIQEIQQQLTEAQDANQNLEQRVEQLKHWKRPAEARLSSLEEKEASWIQTKKDLEHQLRLQTEQTKACRQTEALLQRELKSLQELNASFDHLPDKSATALALASVKSKLDALQLDLNTTKEELQVVRADRDRIQLALDESMTTQRAAYTQLDQVKEKYGKLREALELQKQASLQAEQRALRAEELAGRGSFNPSTTRVVHLSQNPLTTALKEQNANLKQQLEDALASSSSTAATTTPGASKMYHKRSTPQSAAPAATTTTAEVNPDKLHQRLKQQFQHQIALFREGVHLITGYKIDMLPDHDRPTFRVRTMYAERERDELIFQWPKGKEGQTVTSLDLLYSEWAKLLMKSASYDYVTKYHSVPAFVASVQLEQFESTTKIMM